LIAIAGFLSSTLTPSEVHRWVRATARQVVKQGTKSWSLGSRRSKPPEFATAMASEESNAAATATAANRMKGDVSPDELPARQICPVRAIGFLRCENPMACDLECFLTNS
jgi:hypothetical protein